MSATSCVHPLACPHHMVGKQIPDLTGPYRASRLAGQYKIDLVSKFPVYGPGRSCRGAAMPVSTGGNESHSGVVTQCGSPLVCGYPNRDSRVVTAQPSGHAGTNGHEPGHRAWPFTGSPVQLTLVTVDISQQLLQSSRYNDQSQLPWAPLDAEQAMNSLVLPRVTPQPVARLRRVGDDPSGPDGFSGCFKVVCVHKRREPRHSCLLLQRSVFRQDLVGILFPVPQQILGNFRFNKT